MLLVFLPVGVIRDRLRGGPDLKKLGYGFDAADPKQARAAAAVAALDVESQVALEPRRGRDLPAVTPPGGSSVRGPEAVRELFNNLRLLRTLRFKLIVPGVAGLFARLLVPSPAPPPAGGSKTGPQAPAAAS
jgi:hypothetical protein